MGASFNPCSTKMSIFNFVMLAKLSRVSTCCKFKCLNVEGTSTKLSYSWISTAFQLLCLVGYNFYSFLTPVWWVYVLPPGDRKEQMHHGRVRLGSAAAGDISLQSGSGDEIHVSLQGWCLPQDVLLWTSQVRHTGGRMCAVLQALHTLLAEPFRA